MSRSTSAVRINGRQETRRSGGRPRPEGRREPVPTGRVALLAPEAERQAIQAARAMEEGCIVVLDLRQCREGASLRILDFLAGVAYSGGYGIVKIAPSAYLITPPWVEVRGWFHKT